MFLIHPECIIQVVTPSSCSLTGPSIDHLFFNLDPINVLIYKKKLFFFVMGVIVFNFWTNLGPTPVELIFQTYFTPPK